MPEVPTEPDNGNPGGQPNDSAVINAVANQTTKDGGRAVLSAPALSAARGTPTSDGSGQSRSAADRSVQMAARDPKLDHIARQLGMSRIQLGEAIHRLKKDAGLGGTDNVDIDPLTGDAMFNDESIGNVFDAK